MTADPLAKQALRDLTKSMSLLPSSLDPETVVNRYPCLANNLGARDFLQGLAAAYPSHFQYGERLILVLIRVGDCEGALERRGQWIQYCRSQLSVAGRDELLRLRPQ